MKRTTRKRQKRERKSLGIANFLRREGRRCCAVALCASMVMGNAAQASVTIEEDADGITTYDMDSISLYGALQKAVLDGNSVEKEFVFEGETEETYEQLLGETKDLYELTPEIDGEKKGLALRIFARLDQNIDLDRGYEISGDEAVIFLLTNKSKETKKAIIQVDEKKSETITAVPKSILGIDREKDAYLSAADMNADPDSGEAPGENGVVSGSAGGSSSGSGGSSGGGGKGDRLEPSDTLEGMVDPEETKNAEETEADKADKPSETGKAPEISIELEESKGGQENNPQVPDVNIVDQENKNPDDNSEEKGQGTENPDNSGANGSDKEITGGNTGSGSQSGEDKGDSQDSGNQGNHGNGNDGTHDNSSDGNSEDSGSGKDSGNHGNSDNSGNHNNEGSSGNDGGNHNSGEGGEAGEAGEAGDSNGSEAGSGDEKGTSLTLSQHFVGLVASGKETAEMATPSNATPSDANVAEKEETQASPSNAGENYLEGTWYEPVLMDGNAVVAFVTTASELGLDDDRFQMMYIYEPEVPLEGVRVRVGVSPTAFSEEVTLHVKELEKEGDTSEQYQKAEEALAREEMSYEGMVALDISFLNAEGQEVEPEEEALVSIKMDRELLPEGISPEAISVQHHKEDKESGEIEVKQVVDPAKAVEAALRLEEREAVSREDLEEMSGGVLEMSDEALVTEFSVESFSTFTITWNSIYDENSKCVTIHYVDEKGTDITCDKAPSEINKSFIISTGTIAELENYAYSIDGYRYQGAHLGNVEGEVLTQINGYYSYGSYKFEYTADGNSWKNLDNNSDIYLVYKGSTPTPPALGADQDMTHEKKAVRKEDGTYDLTLTVSGGFGSESKPVLLDVIYVVDESGSMVNDGLFGGYNRFIPTKKAIGSLTNALAENKKIDPRFSVVTFSGSKGHGDIQWNDAQIKKNWTSNKTDISSISFKAYGGTNYQAGIREAKSLLSSKRENAITAVIFISDGDPTFCYSDNGYTIGEGNTYDREALEAAKTEVSTLYTNYFFAVGVGNSQKYQRLRTLVDSVPDTTTKAFFSTSDDDTASLTNAFNTIQDSITTFLCSDVTVTDTLSDEVEIVKTADGSFEELEILVTKEGENGNNVVKVAEGKSPLNVEGAMLTARYGNSNGKTQIIMDFPENYELKKGYTYQVKAHIKATEAAYEKYRSDGWTLTYQDIPGEGTGTHAEEKERGLYSNSEAIVNYKFKNENKTEEYSKPVIQLNPGELKIEKTISGLDDEHLSQLLNGREGDQAGLSIKTVFSWEGKTDEISIPLKDLKTGKTTRGIRYEVTKDNKDKYTIYFRGLSPNTSYTITEENAEMEGYSLNANKINDTGTIGKEKTATATFTNIYNKKLSLTIKKIVTGNMGDKKHSFHFTYQVMKDGKPVSDYKILDKEGKEIDRTENLSLADSEWFTISNIPEGAAIVVAETDGDDYKTEISKTGTSDWKPNGNDSNWKPDANQKESAIAGKSFELILTDNEEVTFINGKSISSPTGIHSNRLPYLLMLVMAALGMTGMLTMGTAKVRKKNDEQ